MAELKLKRLKASTLPEVIISMIIILLVFGLAMGIYANVWSHTYPVRRVKAAAMARQMMLQSIADHDWTDREEVQDSLVFKQVVIPCPGMPDLRQITVSAYENDQEIASSGVIARKGGDEHQ